jgi:hypothetical protein
MFGYEKIGLSLTFNPWFLILSVMAVVVYSFYVYRFTLPPVSKIKKFILTFLRSLSLVLLLFIFFEPVLSLTKIFTITPIHLFFVDDSKSMQIQDGTDRINSQKNVVDKALQSNLSATIKFYSFGSSVQKVNSDSLNNLDYSEPTTNFLKIFGSLNLIDDNIASITIVSDGVITEGSTPTYTAEKIGVPVFTVGIGDSARKNDIELKNILHNDFIYAETPTIILATILNRGFSGKAISASLFEGSKLIEQKNFVLDQSGVNSISFDYTPKESGEKKLNLKIGSLDGEATFSNNQKVFFINVLSNKINVLLLAGSPTADLTFVKNTLSIDENLRVNTLTQIGVGRFLEDNINSKLDSANIIFLLSFPTVQTSEDFLNQLTEKLENRSIPFFILFTNDIDRTKLNRIDNLLPFSVQNIDKNYLSVQPDIQVQEIRNPIIQTGTSNLTSEWNNLPPILQPIASITLKPGSKLISKIRLNNSPRNVPLIVTRNIASKRSIAVIGKDIWRWKLQTSNKVSTLFDNFIINSTRWLNAPEDKKRVRIVTSKKIYSLGEVIEFSAQVYDDAFNPVTDAEVKVILNNNNDKTKLNLTAVGSGLYEGSVSLQDKGDYYFSGSAYITGKLLGDDKGNFNVGDVEIEFLVPRMDYEFLSLLSAQTKGRFFKSEETDELLNELRQISLNSSKEKTVSSELRLWSYEWLLAIVIFLFALEWFFRKRVGML